ncbi:hypothetical protein F3Y22_tig00110864pilonHSYRG00421 [Hibiscus syriacus]|uniref:Alpha/beta hydrolase fold-3 domain-containing protein n=1 Tax=Hibiscus syriacus TaxID=106335 RepID=A0A6A2ZJU5_HIBSY|nr:hypothetical protein F3Y22_tig00110864pilonHSYRG00421 [Hibiscus syriacus]
MTRMMTMTISSMVVVARKSGGDRLRVGEYNTMAAESIPLGSTTDPCEYLMITVNLDGTITRSPHTLPTALPNTSTATVISKDIPINPSNNTWARIFLPKQWRMSPKILISPPQIIPPKSATVPKQPTCPTKLPLLLYFHGRGFILGSPNLAIFHEFCSKIAGQLPVLLVSAGYRLAPEHQLPAAYDDGIEAFAGGNMAYHVGLRAARQTENLSALKIKGLILHQPFYGGVRRRRWRFGGGGTARMEGVGYRKRRGSNDREAKGVEDDGEEGN